MKIFFKMKVNRDVIQAKDGEMAFKKYVKYDTAYPNCIKLIIMDIDMPIMNGFESTDSILSYKK